MTVLENSKKIIGAQYKRIGRYSEHKAKNKIGIVSGIKNPEFK